MRTVPVEFLNGEALEATVSYWYSEEGDRVESGDDLVEVSTDEGSLKITAPCSGILREVFLTQGEPVRKGDILCEIDEG